MKLFKGDTIKKVNKLLDKGEARRTKLQETLAQLQIDAKELEQAKMDDFNEAILNDGTPSKKLASDLEKVRGEIQDTQNMLGQLDSVIHSEIEKQKEAVEKERREYVDQKGEEFRELFDEMNELKLAYLEKLIEYYNKHKQFESEYSLTFRDVAERLNLRLGDPRELHRLFITQSHQIADRYSPVLTPDEQREAFMNGKLTYHTEKNKDAFKK